MAQTHPNVLIGGASHLGKTALSLALGKAHGCDVFSTDNMARHPGRPWPNAKPHVAEFYRSMSHDSIFTFLQHHHRNMWPGIQSLLQDRLKAGSPCIIEGSALRPEFFPTLNARQNFCFCLVAPAAFIEHCIHTTSSYSNLSADLRQLIDVFVERSVKDNAAVVEAADVHAIECVDASDPDAVAHMQNRLAAPAFVAAS